jgi:hypothetical protein
VSGFSFNFGIRFPPFYSSVMTAMSFANLDFISVTPMGCLFSTSYHHQLLTYTILPLVACAALLGLYVPPLSCTRERSECKKELTTAAHQRPVPTTARTKRAERASKRAVPVRAVHVLALASLACVRSLR